MGAAAERSDYYVYLCRVAGRLVYVDKGCGYRMNRHRKTSHNQDLRELLAFAEANGIPVTQRKLSNGLTNTEALRLEARCFEKWRSTLLNRNNPYRALDAERAEAEWTAMYEVGEFDSFIVDVDRLNVLNDIDSGLLTREDAIAQGLLDPNDDGSA